MTREDFEQCVTEQYADLIKRARRWTGEYADAEDVVQSVLVTMARQYEAIPATKAIHYLRRAVYLGTRHARPHHLDHVRPQPPQPVRDSSLLTERIEDALQRLPAHVKYLVELVYYNGYSVYQARRATAARFGRVITRAEAERWVKFRGKVGRVARGEKVAVVVT